MKESHKRASITQTSCCPLEDLPLEIKLLVLRCLDGLPTLRRLLVASRDLAEVAKYDRKRLKEVYKDDIAARRCSQRRTYEVWTSSARGELQGLAPYMVEEAFWNALEEFRNWNHTTMHTRTRFTIPDTTLVYNRYEYMSYRIFHATGESISTYRMDCYTRVLCAHLKCRYRIGALLGGDLRKLKLGFAKADEATQMAQYVEHAAGASFTQELRMAMDGLGQHPTLEEMHNWLYHFTGEYGHRIQWQQLFDREDWAATKAELESRARRGGCRRQGDGSKLVVRHQVLAGGTGIGAGISEWWEYSL